MGILPHDAGPAFGDDTPGDERVRRRLSAILAADIKGYSALMDGNEDDTHRRVGAEMDRLVREIEKSSGSIFSFAGDGLMAEFPSAVEALKCALRVQADAAERGARVLPHQRIQYRMGINAGEVLSQKGHTGGTAVNVAARLEQIAAPGSIFLSEAVYDQVNHAVTAKYDRVGQPNLKNLREPVVVFSISAEECRTWAGLPGPQDRAAPARLRDPRASLAVLPFPFRVQQPDATGLDFAEGVADDIVRLLGGHRDLIAVVRTATADVPRSPIDLKRIRHDLDVRYVLHGNLRRSRGQLRLSVELTEAESGRVIWLDRFDGEFSDPFALQDRIALRVAAAVVPAVLDRETTRAWQQDADSLTAYDLTLQAAELTLRLQRVSFPRAGDLLRQAVARDAAYRPARSEAAWWHATCIDQGWSEDPAADTGAAVSHVQAALALDRDDPHALALAGHVHAWLLRDPRQASGFLERALAVGSACAWSWSFAGLASACAGDGETALSRAAEALRLSPLGPNAGWHQYGMAFACYVSGRYQDAVDWGIRSADRMPGMAANLRTLAASLAAIGHMDEARAYSRQLLAVDPAFRVEAFCRRLPLASDRADQFAERLCCAGLPA
jgi:class 3 adenylate cyclase/TolB-like protein